VPILRSHPQKDQSATASNRLKVRKSEIYSQQFWRMLHVDLRWSGGGRK
jgi:hypothetical protein